MKAKGTYIIFQKKKVGWHGKEAYKDLLLIVYVAAYSKCSFCHPHQFVDSSTQRLILLATHNVNPKSMCIIYY
jgi:hypothetical protein